MQRYDFMDSNLNTILQSIPSSVTLIAVSKTKPVSQIKTVFDAGVTDFAENYVQEFVEKTEKFKNVPIHWHYVGHLQSNKVKQVVGRAHLIHSVDRNKLAVKINQCAENLNLVQECLIQVNLSHEEQKSGVAPSQLKTLLKDCAGLSNIRVRGLMLIGTQTSDAGLIRKQFAGLRELLGAMNDLKIYPHELTELSMGMSDSYQIAIEEGATMVRIGSKIFGERS